MIFTANRLFGGEPIDPECWMIGDTPEDEQAAAVDGINFMQAQVWRDWFRPGAPEHSVTPRQLEFLEGTDLFGRN
ncbi:hypothetical protein [Coleofasciculus sp. FACHB-T130]|uniref:hypothetical protein n=1 Tax=Cyanophyceae TaxID=3028117 RepID=UPI0016845808|nr:hypothetical protein [Coleofasciculus sp. FACHB-T130]MBD1879073.1 hypothetical protein [Coleofasciculus sp. FACHB-T130]